MAPKESAAAGARVVRRRRRGSDAELNRRRAPLWTAAALTTVPLPSPAATGLSRVEVSSKLSRVPIFAVTNAEAAPYLTEFDDSGRRSGLLFLSPNEAVQALTDIKAFDPRASLSVVQLDDVYYEISSTKAEASAAPQPKAGTSTDLRLFRLSNLAEETTDAARLSPQKLAEGAVPLFYEPSLTLPVDGVLQEPYFLRFGDLQRAYEARGFARAGRGAAQQPAVPRVAALSTIVSGLESGEISGNSLFVAASDAAGVVARMSNGEGLPGGIGGGGGGGGAVRDEFFLSVPFGNGRKG